MNAYIWIYKLAVKRNHSGFFRAVEKCFFGTSILFTAEVRTVPCLAVGAVSKKNPRSLFKPKCFTLQYEQEQY